MAQFVFGEKETPTHCSESRVACADHEMLPLVSLRSVLIANVAPVRSLPLGET